MELPIALKKNSIIRKSLALAAQLPRFFNHISATAEDYRRFPPLLVNSFPKSGTHLLLQIIEAIPATINYGSFIASTPSITFRERSYRAHMRLLRSIAPREIVSAHLFHNAEYQYALESINCVHYFIYRDLRDVVISEAHYLTFMNKWHRMHPYYRQLPDMNACISQAILGVETEGFPYDYPNIARRFQRYEGWINAENVCAIKFEDLIGEDCHKTVERMMQFYARHLSRKIDSHILTENALLNIDPHKSHTFRKGEVGQWISAFTEKHNRQIETVAGDLLRELGYK